MKRRIKHRMDMASAANGETKQARRKLASTREQTREMKWIRNGEEALRRKRHRRKININMAASTSAQYRRSAL